MPKTSSIKENKQIENLTLLLKEKEQEVRIAKQKAGFFARKHAESVAKLGKIATVPQKNYVSKANSRRIINGKTIKG